MSAQVAADLRAAADVLEDKGWTQFGLIDSDGCLCVSGALAHTASGTSTYRPGELHDAAWDRWLSSMNELRRAIGSDDVMDWNDEPGRTAVEVIAALRAAADRAEAVQ